MKHISANFPAAGLKARLRSEAMSRRREVWLRSGETVSRELVNRGLSFARATVQATGCIAGYYPIRDEIDCLPLLSALHDAGFAIALPKLEGVGLRFKAWTPGMEVLRGRFGLREPGESCPEIIPLLVLAPLLAFDARGNRLGYGGGYYDTALRKLHSSGHVIACGVAFDEQEISEIPREPQDEPLDAVLTPTRLLRFGD